ncbi:MAG TPA: transcriptional repressor LexA [Polyangia bacterium]|jgi:repressor LexA|nr:transcriptional repressor LexA [Polyangia bacterium]
MGTLTLVRDDTRGVLTDRQQEILGFISQSIEERGYPPTLREIGEHFGIRSTNGVNDHLRALEKKGHLQREDLKSRALRPVGAPPSASAASKAEKDDARFGDMVEIPVVGRVAAGLPLLAVENVQDTVHVDRFFIGQSREVFALRVKGESMIEDGIFDGDYIFVKKQLQASRGDIVVAMISGPSGDEATVKRYYPEGDNIRFQPANAAMQPIIVKKKDFRSVNLIGIVVGVYRKMN